MVRAKKTILNLNPGLGKSSNVVVRLLKHTPSHLHRKVYFDSYYNSRQQGISSLKTVMMNQIPNHKLPDEKYMKNHEIGSTV